EARRPQEPCPCAYEREAAEFEILEHFEFGHSEPALEQQRGGGIEDLEVAWIEDDSGGIAVAPFDPHRASIAGRRHCGLNVAPCAMRRRGGSPRRSDRHYGCSGARAPRTHAVHPSASGTAPRHQVNPAPPGEAHAAWGC